VAEQVQSSKSFGACSGANYVYTVRVGYTRGAGGTSYIYDVNYSVFTAGTYYLHAAQNVCQVC